jgi:hypothetical protein
MSAADIPTQPPASSVLDFYSAAIGSVARRIPAASPVLPELSLLAFDTSASGSPWTVTTLGMSACSMNTPSGRTDVPQRTELICYLPSIEHRYTWWIQWLAEFPFIDDTWIGNGHTVYRFEPLFPDSLLQHFLFLPPRPLPHREMPGRVRVENHPVQLLWVVPITDAEREFKLAHGADALAALLDRHRLPLVLDPVRPSVV